VKKNERQQERTIGCIFAVFPLIAIRKNTLFFPFAARLQKSKSKYIF
jgi:hypothetical protein